MRTAFIQRSVVPAVAFVTLTAIAYLAGRSFRAQAETTPIEASARTHVEERDSAAPQFTPREAPQLPFTSLYAALEAAPREQRRAWLGELRTITNTRERRAGISSFFKCYAMVDTAEAISAVQELESDDDQVRAVEAVLKGAPTPSTPALVQMLMDLPGPVGERCREEQLAGQIGFWSAFDPVAAAHFVEAHPGAVTSISGTELLSNWAALDPHAAAAWLEGNPEVASEPGALSDFILGFLENDPAAARDYVITNASDERFQRVLDAVTILTFFTSSEEAAGFVRSLPTPELRRDALSGLARVDPQLFAGSAAERPGQFKQLTEWLLQFQPAERDGSVGTALLTWQKRDPAAAFQWIGELAPGTKQSVIQEYAAQLGPEDVRFTLACPDAELRESVLRAFLHRWGNTIEERQTFVDILGVGPEEREHLAAIASEP